MSGSCTWGWSSGRVRRWRRSMRSSRRCRTRRPTCSGTGKELVARAIHENSPRRDKPFVAINCGAIPVNLLESELFGHKKGSFTGAVADHRGLFEVADGGTMFLDEVAELQPPLQVKLLRVIQERTIRPVGGTADIKVDVRLISATNKQLEDEVRKGTFREDLFYRLNVIEIKLPPLRQRREDIPVLAQHFLEKYAKEMGKGVQKLSSEAMAALMGYGYPGNIRELENIIERSVALETTTMIRMETLPPALLGERGEAAPVVPPVEFPSEGIDLDRVMETIEREWLLRALDRAGGVKTKAAALLGINRRSLHYRLAKYELEAGDGEETEAS
ncbi:MAG: sigma-54-dependent Fis family transcriptional regulator [Deltaproteobacteria bacterium]|nr:sigma-54-dependent Fis family transcriptional regulator [Deltaproteobacteria bacterium]